MFPVLWWSSNCYCRLVSMVSISMMLQKHTWWQQQDIQEARKCTFLSQRRQTLMVTVCYICHIWWTVSNVLHFRIPVTEANPHDCQSQRAVFPLSVKQVNIRSNIKVNTFSDAFLCNEHGKWDLMCNVGSLSLEQWAKNCDHSKAFKTKALCMNSLRKKEHFVAYTVKLGAVWSTRGFVSYWMWFSLSIQFLSLILTKDVLHSFLY